MVEQLTLNQLVLGSSPTRGTIHVINHFSKRGCYWSSGLANRCHIPFERVFYVLLNDLLSFTKIDQICES